MSKGPFIFAAALDSIERVAKNTTEDEKDKRNALFMAFVYSGGWADEHQEEIPGLFTVSAQAIDNWRMQFRAWLIAKNVSEFRFVQPPKLELFKMTVADEMQTHRLQSDRYGVRCKVAALELLPPESQKPAAPAPRRAAKPGKRRQKLQKPARQAKKTVRAKRRA